MARQLQKSKHLRLARKARDWWCPMTSLGMSILVVGMYLVLLGPFYIFRYGPWLRERCKPAATGQARMSRRFDATESSTAQLCG